MKIIPSFVKVHLEIIIELLPEIIQYHTDNFLASSYNKVMPAVYFNMVQVYPFYGNCHLHGEGYDGLDEVSVIN